MVKVLVGGEREGWLTWSDMLAKADTKHTAVKTHKDEVKKNYFFHTAVLRIPDKKAPDPGSDLFLFKGY
jgi:hypothetical protein